MNTINIKTNSEFLINIYSKVKPTLDSGLDLYCSENLIIPANVQNFRIDLNISAAMVDKESNDIGYMLIPRSSTGSKTPIRMCNSIGIIGTKLFAIGVIICSRISQS